MTLAATAAHPHHAPPRSKRPGRCRAYARRMSYSFSTGPVSKADAVAAIGAAAEQAIQGIHEPCQAPAHDHVNQLCEVLPLLLSDVGSPDATVTISVSGHANPGHGKYEGWADEMLNVQISATEPALAEPDVEPTATE